MLDDPAFTYQSIAKKLGLTRQRIAQLANDIGVNGRRRQRQRTLRREPRIIAEEYPPSIQAVINKVRQSGVKVRP